MLVSFEELSLGERLFFLKVESRNTEENVMNSKALLNPSQIKTGY